MNQTHHWVWMVVVIVIAGAIIYIWRPNSYEKGSIHEEIHRQDWPLSIHVGEGGCAARRPNDTAVKSSVKH